MARFLLVRARVAVRLSLFLLAISTGILAGYAAKAQPLYEQPMLVINEDLHTATIRSGAVDSSGQFAATGSEDKTVRIWSLADGKLVRTIRLPAGPGYIGQIYAVAMSPDGNFIAAGGWTTDLKEKESIYLLDRKTGKIIMRIVGLDDTVSKLAFSADGRYLAAGSQGLRIYDRDKNWGEAFRDNDFEKEKYIYGMSFAADYRLAVASYDGRVKLYGPDTQVGFRIVVPPKLAKSGEVPHGIAFSPDGNLLALGYANRGRVDLLDGHNLESLGGPGPSTENLGVSIPNVAWSRHGTTLFGGGYFDIFVWSDAGQGQRRILKGSSNTIRSVDVLEDGRVFFAAAYLLKCLKSDGDGSSWEKPTTVTRFSPKFLVSADGAIVDFGLDPEGKALLRFDVNSINQPLTIDPPADHRTLPPKLDGLLIEHVGELSPTLKNQPIELDLEYERSRSLAIHPNESSFVLGTSWALRAIDANNKHLWRRDTLGVQAVNITADGRLVVALYDDGTIHWHRMDNGVELLALMVLPLQDKNKPSKDNWIWVAWTPDGFYASSPEATNKLQYYVNDKDGFNVIGRTYPITTWPKLHRPQILQLLLKAADINQTLGLAGLAELNEIRLDVQNVTGAAKAAGPRLHVLTVGINEFGENADFLHLKFAKQDSEDLADAFKAQGPRVPYSDNLVRLYSEVIAHNLSDAEAKQKTIFSKLGTIRSNLDADQTGRDLVIVMISTHGMVIGNQFYLLPYEVDARTKDLITGSAIDVDSFYKKIAELAKTNPVLVLLDACHSGVAAGDGTTFKADADRLYKDLPLPPNVTVITSSKGDQISREDPAWQHSAFTRLLLNALSGSATDIQTDHGIVTVNNLIQYLQKTLPELTDQNQQVGMIVKFNQGIFIAGL